MYDIKHLITIDASPEVVFKAVTTEAGIRGWWTAETSISPVEGSIAEFDFGGRYHNEMKITELVPNRRVAWECLVGDEEWVGTGITFDLEQSGAQTILRFGHNSWRSQTDFLATCNFHWGQYMVSIKNYCETGKGNPYSG